LNGCIAYKGATEKFHHTWFSYLIIKNGVGFIEAKPQTLQPNEIGFRLGPYGRNTAN
jgi:hypothetical protein